MSTQKERDTQLEISFAKIEKDIEYLTADNKKQGVTLDFIKDEISKFTFVKQADFDTKVKTIDDRIGAIEKYNWFFKFLDLVTGNVVKTIAFLAAAGILAWLATNLTKYLGGGS